MERIDDLNINGYKIIQDTNTFCFGTDAVMLSEFCRAKKKDVVLDLCSGGGIIPILCYAKYTPKHIYAVEIQEQIYNMAQRSIALNNLSDKITMYNADLNFLPEILVKENNFSLITCNPPYKKLNSGIVNENECLYIARHEAKCTLEQIVKVSSSLLCHSGRLCMVHTTNRLCEIITTMSKYSMEVKRLRFVCAKKQSSPSMVLVEAVKGAKSSVIIEPNIILYDENGIFTEQAKMFYKGVYNG